MNLDKCSTNCQSDSDLIGYPCGHPFCFNCAIEAEEPARTCPKCKQGLRCFAGFRDTTVFHRVYVKVDDDLIPCGQRNRRNRRGKEARRQLELWTLS
ncbi:hypothetical protein M3Y94_00619700 [Aphelenchoides besseyi]|nr:hypothetical protein M3Y94_00619700 [Aphelenchoides besseyi]